MKSMQPNINRHYAFFNNKGTIFPSVESDSCSDCSTDAVKGSPKKQNNNFMLPVIPKTRSDSIESCGSNKSLDELLGETFTPFAPKSDKPSFRRNKEVIKK